MSSKHTHDFLDCGYDEQQCDSACRAQHECGICGKSRSELAKDIEDVKLHVANSIEAIIEELRKIGKLPTLNAMTKELAKQSVELAGLAREQIVEMAAWKESR